jgi:hypothetical protein
MAHENTSGEHRFVRLSLTEEQRAQVQAATGREAEAIELGMMELEERIAPITITRTIDKASPK